MDRQVYLDKMLKTANYLNLYRIGKAYDFGKAGHEGQLRKDGTPFFGHPLAVSLILAELQMDEDTIISGILHDTVEDTSVTSEDIAREFGPNVQKLVDGVTKLANISYESKQELQAENLRKMLIAMSSDLRVIIVKLADRLHNMRTLGSMKPEKQVEISNETLNIFAPIANRLGIFSVKWELEDIALKYIDPDGYTDLVKKVNAKRAERESVISGYIEQIKKGLDANGLKYEIYGRPKNFYSIYKKMKFQKKEFDEIYDLTAIRIILDEGGNPELYNALGVVHSMWSMIPGRFKDYVSTPKANMYRSLHTTVMGHKEPFEVQIRTREMHEQAEYGVAAHWKYKEGSNAPIDDVDRKIKWFRQMMEYQSETNEPSEFLNSVASDLQNSEVLVFTPNGDIYDLPEGSTPIDFAYRVHSQIGNTAVGAKVNGRIVPINYPLQSGQVVEILTSKTGTPSRDWLKFVKSSAAKQRIRQWFKKEKREENIEKGTEMLLSDLKRLGINHKKVLNDNFLYSILRRLSLKSMEDMYNSIGYGGILTSQVTSKVKEKLSKEKEAEQKILDKNKDKKPEKQFKPSSNGIIVKGIDDILVRFAKCCTPVPGDPIIGYITRGRGVTVHRADCSNFEKSDDTENRFIEVEWANATKDNYYASVQVICTDRKGLVADFYNMMNELDMTMSGFSAKTDKNDIAILNLGVDISSIDDLNRMIRRIKTMPDVIEVKRTNV